MKTMAEYIERKALLNDTSETVVFSVKELQNNSEIRGANKVIDRIKAAPTADVQEVRHGKWIEKPYLLGTSNFCSLCLQNFGMPHGKFNFCPHCGAKMDM